MLEYQEKNMFHVQCTVEMKENNPCNVSTEKPERKFVFCGHSCFSVVGLQKLCPGESIKLYIFEIAKDWMEII